MPTITNDQLTALNAAAQNASFEVANLVSFADDATNAVEKFAALVEAIKPDVAAPPIVVPPVIVPPVQSGSGLSTSRLIGDDFTSYKSTSELQASKLFGSKVRFDLVSLDTGVLYNGHPTMKCSYPGGTQAYPMWSLPFPKPLDIAWFRAKVRWSPGWTTKGTGSGANAFKLFGWTHDLYDGSGRLEITNTDEYQVYWNVQARTNGGPEIGGGQFGIAGNIVHEWSDGAFYDYTIKLDRSAGSYAVASLYIAQDGQSPVLRATTKHETMDDGSVFPHITGMIIPDNFNQVRAANQSQSINIGQLEVIDGVAHPNPYGL